MSYTILISQKNSVRRTRLGPRWLVFAVGLGKENFWLDRRSSRDPSRKGEHIRKPYSAAKIVSISPGAMPPFTLETHTINAKLNLPILPKGVFWCDWSSVSFAECHTEQNYDVVCHSQKNPVVASLWPIGTGLSPLGWENFWLRRIRKRASPAKNSEKKSAKSIACENYHLAGPRPLYFTQKTHAERKNQPFPRFRINAQAR